MNIFYLFYDFFLNGVKTFRSAAAGRYDTESDDVRMMRDEIMDNSISDSERLRRDWKNVSRDVRTSFNKLTMQNG